MMPATLDPPVSREDVLEHLDQVLTDRRFAASERNARFLRYVVEATLEGRAAEVKESVIAVEVYGRSTGYDSKADSIVRVEATRLRQKLRSYYENEGRNSAVRFQLPKGGYVPLFERGEPVEANAAEEAAAAAVVVAAAGTGEGRRSVMTRGVGLLAVMLMAAAAAALAAARIMGTPGLADSQAQEAAAAWQEGVALLNLDPHSAKAEGGPPKTLVRAIERLEFSVARDAGRAPAWAALAEAYDYASGFVGRDLAEDSRRMEAAANRAIALDPRLSAGHHMLGLLHKGINWEFGKAEAAYRKALALEPANASAAAEFTDLLWETGRPELAAAEIRRARALLPASPALAVKEAELQIYAGRPDAAIVTLQEAIDLRRTYLRSYWALGMAYEAKGDYREALERYQHVLRANPSDRRALPAYGYLLARMGETKRAKTVVEQLEKMNTTMRNCAFQVAVVYAGLGDDKAALDWLEKAWRTRQSHFPFAAVEYRFRKLHANATFRELLGRAGLRPA